MYRQYVQSGIAPGANTVTTSAIAANTIQPWQLSSSLLNPTVNSFTGDGTTTSFTLSLPPASANTVVVTVNGITQSPVTNYSTNNTSLVFTSAPSNASVIRAVQQAMIGTSIVPIDGSVTTSKLGSSLTLSGNTSFSGAISGTSATLSSTLGVTGVTTLTAQPILSSLTASSAVATDASKGLVSVTNTGSGNNVLSASPTLTGTVAAASLSLSSLTSGRVTYAGASGLLSDSANFTYNGTLLSVSATGSSATTLVQFRQLISGVNTGDARITVGNEVYNPLVIGQNAGSSGFTYGSALDTFFVNSANGSMLFGTNNTEKMRITSAGNVGIGTSSPQSTYKLTISGTDTISPSVYLENTTNSKAYSMRATGTSWMIRDNTAGLDRITLDTSGNLGIGTASMGRKLNIAAGTAAGIQFQATGSSGRNYSLFATDSGASVVGALAIYDDTASAYRVVLDSSGNLDLTTGGAIITTNRGAYSQQTKFYQASDGSGAQYETTNPTENAQYYPHIFKGTNNAPTTVEYGRFNQFGLGLGGSNPSSGTGITFPATQSASANVNTLDDYEEGTWTPVFGGTTTTPSVTYSGQWGSYTKIGNRVMYELVLLITAASGGSGTLTISLPLATSSGTNNYHVSLVGYSDCLSDVAKTGYTDPGRTDMFFTPYNLAGGTLSVSALTNDGYGYLMMQGQYLCTV